MPPLCSEKRCARNNGRHRRVSSLVARPVLLIGENIGNGDDDANESDDNVSPDANKSDIRFTLERRQGDDDNNRGNRRDRDRSSNDDNDGRRGGRGGFRGDGLGPNRGFREQDDGGGNNNGGGNGPGNDRGGNGGGNRGGNRGDGSDSEDDDGENDGENDDGKDGKNNDDGKGNDQGNDDDDDDDDDDGDSSPSTSFPPPPSTTSTSSTTSTTSAVEASTTTTSIISTMSVDSTTPTASTTSVISTFTPTPEPMTSTTTSLPIALPVENPSVGTTSTTPISITTSTDNTTGTPQASATPIFSSVPGVPDSSVPPPLRTDPSNAHGKNNNNHRNGDSRGSRGGLSTTSERVLIATGSIGVFIVLCFIVWVVYRAIKKSKQSGRTTWVSKFIPGRGKQKANNLAFEGLDEPNEPLPAYDAGNNNSMEAYGYYEQRKLYPLETESAAYPSAATLQNEMAMRQNTAGQPPPITNYLNLYPQLNSQMADSNDVNSTLRSRMPNSYYNQSEFARQPSDAYNPVQRQVYRASELSSLSSGFGDGDIIIPPPNVMLPKTAIATRELAVADGDVDNIRPFSWMSKTGVEQQQRDTMYTTASDRRSRFRSVNSWVDQQKRRLKRAAG